MKWTNHNTLYMDFINAEIWLQLPELRRQDKLDYEGAIPTRKCKFQPTQIKKFDIHSYISNNKLRRCKRKINRKYFLQIENKDILFKALKATCRSETHNINPQQFYSNFVSLKL